MWLRQHPLPRQESAGDKNSRGRVLLVGGAEFVPGALRLTGEAALRVGAGKLQLATVRDAALALGVLMPEAAMIALPANAQGEIAMAAAEQLTALLHNCDTLIIGPGMSASEDTLPLVEQILREVGQEVSVLLDAAALTCGSDSKEFTARCPERLVLTPNHDELSLLLGMKKDHIAENPRSAAREAAARMCAIVVLKGNETFVSDPHGNLLQYCSHCTGLGTGGSGDVLAGVIGGLLARGAPALIAAAWGVWLHGEAGRMACQQIGSTGFLARELPGLFPTLITSAEQGCVFN
jgi:hydroxyethylthiazole kinase-like uncharacterized protein yjeF